MIFSVTSMKFVTAPDFHVLDAKHQQKKETFIVEMLVAHVTINDDTVWFTEVASRWANICASCMFRSDSDICNESRAKCHLQHFSHEC